MYQTIRTLHLLLASLILPFVVLYGVSAVQMSYDGWFDMRSDVTERALTLIALIRRGGP